MADTIYCPGCAAAMTKFVAPDVTTDQCPNCAGMFFDKGELNSLATGMAGDIELCCLDGSVPDDIAVARRCPGCPDMSMEKVSLLSCLDLVLDFCPECQGLYLDRGETGQMNAVLREVVHSQTGMEFRGDIDGRLACLGNPDPGGMKVYTPAGEETFDDTETTEEAQAGADRRETA